MSTSLKKENNEYDQQESLQAIVFADDFVDSLKPVQQYPSILLPIVTSPLLDYLLETLVRAKVQQVFLYCSSHVEILKAYVESLNNLPYKNITVTPIISDGCRSLGDALRDIDTKGFIRDDFILVRGTAFTNVDLRQAMELHKARKEKDKKVAMTMLMRNFGSTKDSALKDECSLVVSNANTRKMLHYKKLNNREKKVKLELEWFLEQDKVSIDTALFDTRIYLCCQSVLPLFADNFDFQTMEDFIHGVLMNEEFLDSRIYWETLPCSAYSMSLSSWETYKMLCRNILQRQSYPLVPDALPQSMKDFLYMSRSTYKHINATLSKGSSLEKESVIGENSILGKNSVVSRSTIGPRCTIGTNVHMTDSYIISDVIVEDDCDIKNSIIFSSCKLEKGTKLNGCILSPGVHCTKDYSSLYIQADTDGNLVEKSIKQFKDDDDDDIISSVLRNNRDFDEESLTSSSAWSSSSSLSSRNSPLPAVEDDNDVFLAEVIDSLLRGYEDKLKCENLILEINSSRYAYNISIQQVSYNVVKAIVSLPVSYYKSKSESNEAKECQTLLKTMLVFFKPIMLNYIKTESAQEDCLRAVTNVICTNTEYLLSYSQNILHFFYDNDILTEEKIIEWYHENYSDEDGTLFDEEVVQKLKKAVFPFIKWLEEAEEDSSGD